MEPRWPDQKKKKKKRGCLEIKEEYGIIDWKYPGLPFWVIHKHPERLLIMLINIMSPLVILSELVPISLILVISITTIPIMIQLVSKLLIMTMAMML